MRALRKLVHAVGLGLDVERFFHWMQRRHGDTFVICMPGLSDVLFTSNTEFIKHIFAQDHSVLSSSLPSPIQPLLGEHSLILLQGDAHEVERQRLKPFFQGQCLHHYAGAIEQAAQQTFSVAASPWDAQQLFSELTLDIILRVVFGLHDEGRRAQFQVAIRQLVNSYSPLLLLFPPARRPLLGIGPWDRFVKARAQLDELIKQEVAARWNDSDADDMLSLLLRAERSGQGDEASLNQNVIQQTRDTLATLLLAGHETTANTLAWASYYLADDQVLQNDIRQELLDFTNAESNLRRAAMKSPLLDSFCREVMRLRPVVPLVIRSVMTKMQLGEHSLEPGTYVGVATFNLHHQADLYVNPSQFDARRFVDDKKRNYEYVAFGGGNKQCLGYGFALLEIKIILATLLSGYQLSLQRPVQPVATIQGMAMGPKQRIWIECKPNLQ